VRVSLILAAALALTACDPNAPCLHGHDEVPLLDGDTHLVNNYTTSHCVTYYKNGGCHTYWVCAEYGTPYPSGDPRR
jgi:hypothetical protein